MESIGDQVSEKNYYKSAGILLVVGCIQFLLGVNLAQTQFPGYSTTINTLSSLGGSIPLVQPSATIFNTSIILFGILSLVAAYLIFKSGGGRLFSILLVISSVGAIGVGTFPEYTGLTHDFFALLSFLFGSLAVIFSYRLSLNKVMIAVSLVVGLVSLVLLLLVVFLGGASSNPMVTYLGVGGNERLIAYPTLLYLIFIGGYLTSRGDSLG